MNGTGLETHEGQNACELDDFQDYMIIEASMASDDGFYGLCIPQVIFVYPLFFFFLQTWEIINYVK